ncbi:CAP domain-containing protein [Patescibacteria group bacterium]
MTFWEHIKYIFRVLFFPHSLKTMEWKMLKLVNKDRKKHGFGKLRMQQDLRDVARKHSKDMARKDYFEHENIAGQTPFDRLDEARVTDVIAGENLAKIRGFKNPVVKAEIGLMNSPGHRANILHKEYNTVGIGIIKSIDKSFYYTQNFASRDLIFTKKIPHKTTLKKGLKLKGFAFTKAKKIIYQIKRNENTQQVLNDGIAKIENNKFQFHINLKKIGIFVVFIYINKVNNPESFKIANKFEIKVRKGWF